MAPPSPKHGICHLSVVPCRAEASDRSELVSQLLFGELFTITRTEEKWVRIRTHIDGYESWIDAKQYLPVDATAFEGLTQRPAVCAADLVQLVKSDRNASLTPILAGSSLPNYHRGHVAFADEGFDFDGDICIPGEGELLDTLVDNAMTFRNAPYLWGGRSAFGIDCSGLTQVVYKMSGIYLKRDAYQQAEQGHGLSFVEEARPGDLAFFDNSEGKIIHVGMIVGPNTIIHASGKVRVDKLDHQGIHNVDTNRYTHSLRLIKRIID